jgi:hypothetical protein
LEARFSYRNAIGASSCRLLRDLAAGLKRIFADPFRLYNGDIVAAQVELAVWIAI